MDASYFLHQNPTENQNSTLDTHKSPPNKPKSQKRGFLYFMVSDSYELTINWIWLNNVLKCCEFCSKGLKNFAQSLT